MSITDPSLSNLPRLLKRAEVAEILHITERQTARLSQSGALRSVRINGACVRYAIADVEAFIVERSSGA